MKTLVWAASMYVAAWLATSAGIVGVLLMNYRMDNHCWPWTPEERRDPERNLEDGDN